ncbi:peptidyl-prolyl cis-trans isomerase [Salix suchowensis]|nr:peptidyl-prolyl cis-trans isomerase [Salix suchowensis]
MSDIEENASSLGKRPRSDNEPTVIVTPAQVDVEESDDEDVGPMPMTGVEVQKKRRKVLPHERLFLEHLPSADQYYKSFMHRDVINFCVMTKTDFLITSSIDGHVKLWKKQDTGIEFVKHYRAHLRPVTAVSASADGQIFASISEDGTAKVFDRSSTSPASCVRTSLSLIDISGSIRPHRTDSASGSIKIYDARGNDTPLMSVDDLHRFPVTVMAVSACSIWRLCLPCLPCPPESIATGTIPSFLPTIKGFWNTGNRGSLWAAKERSGTVAIQKPNRLIRFQEDRQIRIFSFLTGKLSRKYDESLTAIQEMQQAGTAVYRVEDMEFGRRLAVEKELELPGPDGHVPGPVLMLFGMRVGRSCFIPHCWASKVSIGRLIACIGHA